MEKKLTRRGLLTSEAPLALGFAIASQAATPVGGDAFQPVWVDSLKVQASGTKGRTAHKVYKISAGPDRVFAPNTWVFKESSRSGGGSIRSRFLEDQFVYEAVPTTIDGVTYMLEMPSVIVIEVHAETGSGPGNYNRGAWLNGYVHAETLEIDR